ncbi:hypothetical protein BGZ97_008073 [Linnemannia gamsii]|uniref:Uncharacterized protein n=1 Tax=Linnemannia gamsii TaxID=64522 RepID=A0A9P6UDS1_9FUNG|nr:hypothetical protein BGZ97_008073 [Linnemannia gamsii]
MSVPFGLAGLTGAPGLPMASIENRAAEAILAAYKKDPKNAITWSKAPTNNQVEGGGAPSDFSSFGVDGELRSKPDIGAPGGNIYSAYPVAKGSYTLMSGTSMATPYYVGSQALYYQAKKSKPSGADVRRAFKNTATISKNWKSKTYTSAVKQGAGLVNKITIKNTGKKTETYTLSHVAADALNSYSKGNSFPAPIPVIEADYASVKFSANKVKIPAGKSVKVTLTFTEPKNGDAKHFPLYSGYVIATPSNEGSPAVHVPYIGLKGAVRDVPMIDTDVGAPGLAYTKSNGAFNFKTAAPTIQVRYGSHSPDATIRVHDAKTDAFLGFVNSRKWGSAFGATGRMTMLDEYHNLNIRNYDWHGQVFKTADPTATPVLLPAGAYKLVVASQKKLTKGVYPADFEIFELPTVNVTA